VYDSRHTAFTSNVVESAVKLMGSVLSKLRLAIRRSWQSLRFAASLSIYWLSDLFRGELRARLLKRAYKLDARNVLALCDLLKRTPTLSDDATAKLWQWADSRLLNLLDVGAVDQSDRTSLWLICWAHSIAQQLTLAAHNDTSPGDEPTEDQRLDALYAIVAAMTEASRHRHASLAQRFAVYLDDHSWPQSNSQLGQDRFVLFVLGELRGVGFFVEFGAADGLAYSNTYLLEQEYGWKGIVSEPSPAYQAALRRNRRCAISDRCVWTRTGETVPFRLVGSFPELSTMADFLNVDQHDRSEATPIDVLTISLNDLLRQHNAPRRIDYISIDTEGSELAILEAFDFSAYDVRAFTIEHNFTPAREKIRRLMEANGYKQVLEPFSKWDDWYLRAEIVNQLTRGGACRVVNHAPMATATK
jgi:FkbM family methyltransferase